MLDDQVAFVKLETVAGNREEEDEVSYMRICQLNKLLHHWGNFKTTTCTELTWGNAFQYSGS